MAAAPLGLRGRRGGKFSTCHFKEADWKSATTDGLAHSSIRSRRRVPSGPFLVAHLRGPNTARNQSLCLPSIAFRVSSSSRAAPCSGSNGRAAHAMTWRRNCGRGNTAPTRQPTHVNRLACPQAGSQLAHLLPNLAQAAGQPLQASVPFRLFASLETPPELAGAVECQQEGIGRVRPALGRKTQRPLSGRPAYHLRPLRGQQQLGGPIQQGHRLQLPRRNGPILQ